MNGVKNKFFDEEVKAFLKKFDIVVINETHFNERIKLPDGFIFEGRSKKIESKSPRGGVALYRNTQCQIEIIMFCDSMRDCVVFQIKNSDMVIAAQYIPPSNSVYYDSIYMENLKLVQEKFKKKRLIMLGDWNSRMGDVYYDDPKIVHCTNPDTSMNSNGRQVVRWIEQNQNMLLLNGLRCGNKNFDSNYTFYRGRSKPQNDVAFSNDVRSISSFNILQKMVQSDHCPISIECTINLSTPLEFIHECAYYTFSNQQYDVNRRLKQPIRLDRVDVIRAIERLSEPFELGNDDNNLETVRLTNHIYDCCKDNYKQTDEQIEISGNLLNCTSANFKAIAEANLITYRTLSDQGDPSANDYLENWVKFENLTREAKNKEMNVKVNKSWRDKRYDSKRLWQTIDWKGKAEEKVEKPAHEADTTKYFKAVFQSSKTKDHATISDVEDKLSVYDNYIPSLDDPFTIEELETSLKQIGSGVSLDGIPPTIAQILPNNIKENILELMNRTFDEMYPDEWTKNILHSLTKDGHTPAEPKLRGIAIGPFLSRIYDIMMDIRFCSWYIPNKEQAGGKKEQGCPLQIFMLLMVIDYANEKKKDLFVGFLDYEKAFDYANRAGIVSDLMEKGCGSKFTKAIGKMFTTSTYYPKSNKNYLSEGITTDYGVTQGRRSSGSLFSFYVSDMPDALNDTQYDDFMDPLSLAQLADDSAIYAELIYNLITKFRRVFKYSDEKDQVANVKKTVYANFAENPRLTPLVIDENITLNSIDPVKGYKYIGLSVYPTNDVTEIIKRNVNKRMVNFAKFHAWLSVNELTPIEMKLVVLDSCVFGAVLSSSECWGDISYIEEQLRDKELTALRAILGVKKGTTIDLIYHELRRCSIKTRILDRQFKFYQKLCKMTTEDAIVKVMIEVFGDSRWLRYYANLNDKNGEREMNDREMRIRTSQNSMCKYYCDLHLTDNKAEIYCSMLSDYYRVIISRWRLSNHRLNIETGRYTNPITVRNDRVCTLCKVVEDEQHVIFECPRYSNIRN